MVVLGHDYSLLLDMEKSSEVYSPESVTVSLDNLSSAIGILYGIPRLSQSARRHTMSEG